VTAAVWTREMEAELRQLLWISWERQKCRAKTKYGSQGTAESMAAHISRKWREDRKIKKRVLRAYECRWCGCWHLTTVPVERVREAA
jgi:hypothetical protein